MTTEYPHIDAIIAAIKKRFPMLRFTPQNKKWKRRIYPSDVAEIWTPFEQRPGQSRSSTQIATLAIGDPEYDRKNRVYIRYWNWSWHITKSNAVSVFKTVIRQQGRTL